MGLSIDQLAGLLAGGTPDLGALVGAAGQSDPALGAVLGALAQRRSADAESDDAVDALAERDQRLAELQSRFDQLRDVARRMDGELRGLRRRNAQLAAALGACPHCWGESPDCGTCAGEGVPGSAPRHRSYYQYYVGAVTAPGPAHQPGRASPLPRAIAGNPGAPQD